MCASVCHAVARKPFITFFETLQLVRAFKGDKNVPSAFLKNSRFAHFGQKLSKIGHFGPKCQKMEVFCIFFAIRSLEFANFFLLSLVFGVGKNDVFAFFGKIQKWSFLAKFGSFFYLKSNHIFTFVLI